MKNENRIYAFPWQILDACKLLGIKPTNEMLASYNKWLKATYEEQLYDINE